MPATSALAQTAEVVCPLKNSDGSHCRKRCTGDKRYRSMIEHVRRVHSEHYIAKLPATEESFSLMVNTPPSERPQQPQQHSLQHSPQNAIPGPVDYNHMYKNEFTYPGATRSSDEYRRGSILPAANAAEVLAQLHAHQPPTINWEQDHNYGQDLFTDGDSMGPRLPPIDPPTDPRLLLDDPYREPSRHRDGLNSTISRSPPYRSSTLPPAGRLTGNKPQRPQEDSRDLTPVPPSPRFGNRASLPPLLSAPHFQNNTYTASPLQRALTPPPPEHNDLQPFPSVESSVDSSKSGQNFHISSHGLSDSSPQFAHHVQIYCAGCHRLSVLQQSYACTECICGLCKDCVDAICTDSTRRRAVGCPRCNGIGGKFKPFQLDIR
ncbi:hypothetical protein BT63DRAFT_107338 [Microthyrium microscopicum]|uniref:RING zinc finger-like domain-containing protein n=1 Tax=Microthyrium microscopicum TaxID=703497 RepID=A0A6A6TXE2_9PEZI|nr:hypothetical protein BT63DRAFT_107338 [Microthyrium microscopicum]